MGNWDNNTCVYRICQSKGFESYKSIMNQIMSPIRDLRTARIQVHSPVILHKLTIIMAIIVYSVHLINFDDELKPKVLQQWWDLVDPDSWGWPESRDLFFSYIFLICLLMIFIPSIQILAYRLRGAMCDRKITLVWTWLLYDIHEFLKLFY